MAIKRIFALVKEAITGDPLKDKMWNLRRIYENALSDLSLGGHYEQYYSGTPALVEDLFEIFSAMSSLKQSDAYIGESDIYSYLEENDLLGQYLLRYQKFVQLLLSLPDLNPIVWRKATLRLMRNQWQTGQEDTDDEVPDSVNQLTSPEQAELDSIISTLALEEGDVGDTRIMKQWILLAYRFPLSVDRWGGVVINGIELSKDALPKGKPGERDPNWRNLMLEELQRVLAGANEG